MPLQITVLFENTKDNAPHANRTKLQAGFGLSLLLDDGDTRLVFDTGPGPQYLQNAVYLNENMQNISHVVLSHGHYDHAGGLPHLRGTTKQQCSLICHPAVFTKRYAGFRLGNKILCGKALHANLDRAQLESDFSLCCSSTPQAIGRRFIFAGEIPRSRPTKACGLLKKNNIYTPDYVQDDSALLWQGPKGLVVITGCAHSGICEIIQYAQKITGGSNIVAVVGGFHLRYASLVALYKIQKFFNQKNIEHVYGCHCTGPWGRLWIPHAQNLRTGQRIML